MICDMWHMTYDTRHMTPDRWGEVNLLSKFQLHSSYSLGVKVVLEQILISEDPHCSTLLICLTRLKRQRIPKSEVCHSEEPAGDTQFSKLFSFSSDCCMKSSEAGSPEIKAPSSVFCWGSPKKYVGTWMTKNKNMSNSVSTTFSKA